MFRFLSDLVGYCFQGDSHLCSAAIRVLTENLVIFVRSLPLQKGDLSNRTRAGTPRLALFRLDRRVAPSAGCSFGDKPHVFERGAGRALALG